MPAAVTELPRPLRAILALGLLTSAATQSGCPAMPGEFGNPWDPANSALDFDGDGVPNSEDRCPDRPSEREESICDGLDNDCDGLVDERLGPIPADNVRGVCADNVRVCGGAAGYVDAGNNHVPAKEECNGLDDDCDGKTDEGDPDGGGRCDTGESGRCSRGTEHCRDGWLRCTPDDDSVAEVCNGLDDDCDGSTDEGDPEGGLACATAEFGRCSFGTQSCGKDGRLRCERASGPAVEECNGLDDDCDGSVDEWGVCGSCVPGVVNPDAPLHERWVQVCPGEFLMGSPWDEPARRPSDPGSEMQHRVAITRPILVQATEVTQGQWSAVARAEGWAVENPSSFPGDDRRPVENVTWWEALRYMNALSRLSGLPECYRELAGCDGGDPGSEQDCGAARWAAGPDCEGYRLPTDAEWEYAARAGAEGMFPGCGPAGAADACDSSNLLTCDALNLDLDTRGVYCANNPWGPAPVGSKAPNDLGLHDVMGNVWEWVWDWHSTTHGGHVGLDQVLRDPTGPEEGDYRVVRGGSWSYFAWHCRVAHRSSYTPGYRSNDLGLRPVRTGS